MSKEDLVGGFSLQSNLSKLEKNTKHLHLLFSKKDDVVPVGHAKKYAQKLKNANIIIYKHIKGHFDIVEFPEIITIIKQDVRQR